MLHVSYFLMDILRFRRLDAASVVRARRALAHVVVHVNGNSLGQGCKIERKSLERAPLHRLPVLCLYPEKAEDKARHTDWGHPVRRGA